MRAGGDPWTRVAITGLIWLLFLALVCAINLGVGPARHHLVIVTDVFAQTQDAVVGLGMALLLALIAAPAFKVPPGLASRATAVAERFGRRIAILAAVAVAMAAFAGWWWVFQAYPLSGDEFWAAFDADILQHGRFMAHVPVEWRAFTHALQPTWRLETPDHAWWASTYLPVNAALRAAFGALGSQALAGPAWGAVSIVLVWDLGRRLWPERPDAALVAAILLASSAQLIFAAMTPYAMPAHLAFNLAWLCLFLRKSWAAQAGAIVVAFFATGLHQWIFNPLFAAPFVIQLWAARRWRAALTHTIAYALICAFWMAWPGLLFLAKGYPFLAPSRGAAAFALANAFNPFSGGLMAENLLRLTTWQNLLAVPLALAGAGLAARNRTGPLFAMAAGMVLIVAFLAVVTPFQGHGWGYRYLHGYLGSLCLLATAGWVRLTTDDGSLRRGWAALAVACAVSVGVCLPLRAGQAWAYAAPSVRNWTTLTRTDADVVIVDVDSLWFGMDLVRNDPFLASRPKVMRLDALTPAQIEGLCAHHRVALFAGADEPLTNVAFQSAREHARRSVLRAAASAPPCAPQVTVGPRASP